MKLIKRNGSEAVFDRMKIYSAVEKANLAVDEGARIKDKDIERITASVVKRCEKLARAVSVEEVQDMVESKREKIYGKL